MPGVVQQAQRTPVATQPQQEMQVPRDNLEPLLIPARTPQTEVAWVQAPPDGREAEMVQVKLVRALLMAASTPKGKMEQQVILTPA